jgi:hypothetical protein
MTRILGFSITNIRITEDAVRIITCIGDYIRDLD